MFKKFIFLIFLALSAQASKNSIEASGELFNIQSSAGPVSQISLCLNGKGAISCQTYKVTGYFLSISTVIPNHTYPIAGIKILSGPLKIPTTSPIQCTPIANGYCLFPVSQTSPKTIQLVTAVSSLISPQTMEPARAGTIYSQPFSLTGGQSPLSWSLGASTSSTIQTNFSINAQTGLFTSNATINETTVPPGLYPVEIQVIDSQVPPQQISSRYTLLVSGSLVVNPSSQSFGPFSQNNPSINYSFTVSPYQSGGTYTFTCTNTQGNLPCSLPDGITFSQTTDAVTGQTVGKISGTLSSNAIYQS